MPPCRGYLGADFSHAILDKGLPFLNFPPDPIEGNLGVSVAAYVQVQKLILQAEMH